MSQLSQEEIHIIGLCAPSLLKLLRTREERILKKIHGEFRSGKHDQLTALAEFCSVRDQIAEIESVLRQDTIQQEKIHADAESN